jgi:Mg2+-importing ATPase
VALTATTVAVISVAVVIPFTPAAAALGFVPLPVGFLVFVPAVVGSYLVCVEVVKRRLLKRHLA